MPDPITPDSEPWLRQLGESAEAFAAFSIYLNLGPRRSIDKAYRLQVSNNRATPIDELTMRASGRWTHWSIVFDWGRRALAHDLHLDRIQLKQREALIAEEGIRWADERQLDVRDRLEILCSLRRGLLQLTHDGLLADTRRKTTTPSSDGGWQTSEERLRLAVQLDGYLKLHATLFPPDEIEITDLYGNRWSKFTPAEVAMPLGEVAAAAANHAMPGAARR